ncbi:putative RecB family exonuclease [Campylobacter phage vB_Cj_QDYZ]|uniref:RecB family exonuclease n=1 Tax=Campylobacter phage vB_Cj_QDYZ TaxID=3032374 RepID=A0AAF0GEG4_9CAUD|nr:putative RecB family exonuclease [Campylobacter phage vB_Cj_QDYZ]
MKYRYSYSRLECFRQCKLKFKYSYIDKISIPKDQTALIKGSYIHWLIEQSFKEEPIEVSKSYHNPLINADQYKEYNEIFKKFKETEKYKNIKDLPALGNEVNWALDSKLNPTNYYGNDYVIRGTIDYIAIKNRCAIIIDWKTGKTKDKKYIPDANQLALYAIWAEKVLNVDKIICQFVYVETNDFHTYTYTSDDLIPIKKQFAQDIMSIENEKAFIANPSILCNWCEFKSMCDSFKNSSYNKENNDTNI